MRVTQAITLWPEWAFAIGCLDKRHENRSWEPPSSIVGKRIAIHAGKNIGGRPGEPAMRNGAYALARAMKANGWCGKFGRGPGGEKSKRLFCSFDKREGDIDSGAHRTVEIKTSAVVATAVVGDAVRVDADEGWKAGGSFAWRLSQVRWLVQPIESKGAQGIWRMAPDLVEAIDKAAFVAMPEYFE